jgi:hypothetical protein
MRDEMSPDSSLIPHPSSLPSLLASEQLSLNITHKIEFRTNKKGGSCPAYRLLRRFNHHVSVRVFSEHGFAQQVRAVGESIALHNTRRGREHSFAQQLRAVGESMALHNKSAP